MGLFNNPLGYAGYPADPVTAQKVNSTVRAATLSEVEAGALNNVYVSPLTSSGLETAIFASPPALGNTVANAVFSTTLSSTGNATIGKTGATVNTIGSSNASSTTTLTAGAAVLGLTNIGGTYPGHLAITAPAAGFIGQQIRSAVAKGSAVAVNTATGTNITSISLTPGTWDVSAIGILSGGALTGTIFEIGISTTSATLATLGDSDTQTSVMATATADSTLTIPSLRVPLGVTTTVYLVTTATYSVGSATAYGRLSATRVA